MACLITGNCQGCQACVRRCPTQAITGDRHQVHQIDPMRCIDCGTCGRVCPYDAVVDNAGQPAQRMKRSEWLQPVIVHSVCVACGLCINICPVSCLDLDGFAVHIPPEGFPFLKNLADCVGCGFCAAICPVGAVQMRSRAAVK